MLIFYDTIGKHIIFVPLEFDALDVFIIKNEFEIFRLKVLIPNLASGPPFFVNL